MSALPVGDPTLSAKEIVGNEVRAHGLCYFWKKSGESAAPLPNANAPFYVVGETTGNMDFVFEQAWWAISNNLKL